VALILMVVLWQQRRNFTSLKPWGERHGEEHSAEALSAKMLEIYSSISEAEWQPARRRFRV